MGIILKKFDMYTYIKRRIKILRGEIPDPDDIDEIRRYTKARMREIRESIESDSALDKSLLGCYTVGTMGDRDGET